MLVVYGRVPLLPVTSLPPSASASYIISMPLSFTLPPASPLRPRASLIQLHFFPLLLGECSAHSRSSAMPVSWVKMNRRRIKVVGTGPGVESRESSLVYISE